MSAIGHVHDWGPRRLVDFCHFVEIVRTCKECGARNVEAEPRDFDSEPMQIAFADPYCDRCRYLLDGQEPESWAETKGEHDGQR